MQRVTCSECRKEMSVSEFLEHPCYLCSEAKRSNQELDAHLHWEAVKTQDEKLEPLPFGLNRRTKIGPDATLWLWLAGVIFVLWLLYTMVHPNKGINPSDCDVSTACVDSGQR